MERLKVETTQGYVEHVVYNTGDFPWTKLDKYIGGSFKKKTKYLNYFGTFDIESYTVNPPIVQRGKKKDFLFTPYAFMYQWQFCITNIETSERMVIFGRRWEEFVYLIDNLRYYLKLNNYNRFVMYVHNLPYEFQFIKDFLDISQMFAKDKRKPLKFVSKGIEWRCSYALSNMSLLKFCENSKGCTYYKLSDTYDYSKKRLPNTSLSWVEKQYCFNDVYGLAQCISSLLVDDTLATIPLTNTGYVRREYRLAMRENPNNRRIFEETRLTLQEYKLCLDAFRGGDTHANRVYTGLIVSYLKSRDISSSYPYQMAVGDFPMGKFMHEEIGNDLKKFKFYLDNFCCVFRIKFLGVELKKDRVYPVPYIPVSHCKKFKKIVNDNGRIVSAEYIEMALTNIDFKIIAKEYDLGEFEISEFMYSKKGKLPKEFRQKNYEFYRIKTELKDVDGKEYEYMKGKNRLNSGFGMIVSKIIRDKHCFNAIDGWTVENVDEQKELDDFYKNKNSFLPYQWGIFVTANARLALRTGLDIVKDNHHYSDTDSVKYHGDYDRMFDELNAKIIEDNKKSDIPTFAKNKDGEVFHMGVWDDDGSYKRFRTWGAKKYAYEEEKDGKTKFKITVAGMSKKLGAERVGSLENFELGQTYENVGRTISWYNDSEPHEITIDGCTFITASNIGILETTYKLGVTGEYYELICENLADYTFSQAKNDETVIETDVENI